MRPPPISGWIRVRLAGGFTLPVATLLSVSIIGAMTLGSDSVANALAWIAVGCAVIDPPVGLATLLWMVPLKSPNLPAPGFTFILVSATLLGSLYRLPIERPQIRLTAPFLLLLGFVLYVFVQQTPEMLAGYQGSEGHLVGYQFTQLLTNVAIISAAAWVGWNRSPWPFIAAGLLGTALTAGIAILTFDKLPTGPLSRLVNQSDVATRAIGTFQDPNYFGLAMATAITGCVVCLFLARSWRNRIWLIAISPLLGAATVISLSRTALLVAVAGFLAVAFGRSPRTGIVTAAAVLVLALGLYPLFVSFRVTATNGAASTETYLILAQSDQGRLAATLVGPQLFASAPLFGVGFGHYSILSGRILGAPIAAHNWYLNVLAEQGIVGISLWLAMLVAVAVALRNRPRVPRSMGYAVLAAYSVGSFFLEPPNTVQTSGFAITLIVLALVGDWRGPSERAGSIRSASTSR